MSDLPTTLDGIAALADAATAGPWVQIRPGAPYVHFEPEPGRYYYPASQVPTSADAEFIAHARTLVPRLVEALRWVVEEGVFYEGDTTEIRPAIGRILAGEQP